MDVTRQTDVCSWNQTLQRGNRSFLQLHNPYAAMFVYTVPQMDFFLRSAVFMPRPLTARWLNWRFSSIDVRWAAALGFQKWLPPPGFDSRNVVPFAADALEPGAAVHHLPNTYYRKFGGGAPPGPKRRIPDEQRPATLPYDHALWDCAADYGNRSRSGSGRHRELRLPPLAAPSSRTEGPSSGRGMRALSVAGVVVVVAYAARVFRSWFR